MKTSRQECYSQDVGKSFFIMMAIGIVFCQCESFAFHYSDNININDCWPIAHTLWVEHHHTWNSQRECLWEFRLQYNSCFWYTASPLSRIQNLSQVNSEREEKKLGFYAFSFTRHPTPPENYESKRYNKPRKKKISHFSV